MKIESLARPQAAVKQPNPKEQIRSGLKRLVVFVLGMCLLQTYVSAALAQSPSPESKRTSETDAGESNLSTTPLTEKQLNAKWRELARNEGWQALLKEVEGKGFTRLEQSVWGFRGTVKNPTDGKSNEVLFCAYDFYSPAAKKENSFQTSSMIFGNIGGREYRAYLVYPKGVKEITKALAQAEEWFADEKGKVQKAHSFGTRFSKCIEGGKHKVTLEGPFGFKYKVTANCKTACLASIATCGGVAAILELASGGLGTVPLIGLFGVCAGVGCGSCFAMCALASL